MPIDPISLCTTPVSLLNGEQLLSKGTGFLYAHSVEDRTYVFLITNYHVLTGSAPLEGIAPVGDRVTFYLHKSREQPGDVRKVIYPLYTDGGTPMFVTNADYPEADVALLPLASGVIEGCELQCIAQNWIDSSVILRPAGSVSIVGYPYGLHDSHNCLPVWKTGSLASEPDYDFEGKPLLLVDISVFRGMSGAPVFAIRHGAYEQEEGITAIGATRKFLGVFSAIATVSSETYVQELARAARIGFVTEESLQLGYVWKARILSEAVSHFDAKAYQNDIISRARNLSLQDS